MKLIAIIFTLICTACSFFLAAASRHATLPLGLMALGYWVASLVVLWWRYSRLSSPSGGGHGLRFFLECLAIAASASLLLLAEVQYSDFSSKRRAEAIANTKVWDVRDEMLLSDKGNPIGIRVSFSVQFPRADYYGASPWLSLPDVDAYAMVMQVIGVRQVEPSSSPPGTSAQAGHAWNQPLKYEAGRVYSLVYDLVPMFITPVSFEKLYQGERVFCLRVPDATNAPAEYETFQKLIGSQRETKFKIRIWDTPYENQWTQNEYSFRTFYDGFLKEAPEPCRF
jgi:hypothetical protein